MNKFSIITINKNNAEGLEQTIRTVIDQTYNDVEYIIIDGGSTDGSRDVIKKYESKISYWVSEKDKGIYNAMNKGIVASRKISSSNNKYLLFLNSGDRLHSKNVLEQIANYSEDFIIGKIIRDDFDRPFGIYDDKISLRTLFRRGFPHQGTFFSIRLFDKYLYDESYKIVSDWKFVTQKIIFENVSYININTVISEFDTGGLSTTNHELLVSEVQRARKELLPQRILIDIEQFGNLDDEWINIGNKLYERVGIKNLIYCIVNIILKIFNIK